ncbi:MAG: glutamyl-tRNA reductase [Saprospiraceae bacterium]|nr:glutamyl-tRNA reductase [Saprospiraceae bacterium]
MLSKIHILTVSHKELPLDKVTDYAVAHHNEEQLRDHLKTLKERNNVEELFYLSTCNRVLYLFVTGSEVDRHILQSFFGPADLAPVQYYTGAEAVFYLFQVASSIHSMVLGEREIITQLRTAYEQQKDWDLPGDTIRLLVQQTVRAAKKVYRSTKIGEKPVSVVSLAVKTLLEFKINSNTPIILVGAGSTNQLVVRHLTKKGFNKISVYNRTIKKAKSLGENLIGKTGSLEDLIDHDEDFGCVIACTGAHRPVVTKEIAEKISKGNIGKKIWIDLGLPSDIDAEIHTQFADRVINLKALQGLAKANLSIRAKEIKTANLLLEEALHEFRKLMHQRLIEKAFEKIPSEIKDIKEKAITEVFKKDLASLDVQTQDVISRMMNYMEKKCISVPMKVAREVSI